MTVVLQAHSFAGNFRSRPRWMGDYTDRQSIAPFPVLLDPTAFNDYAGVQVVVGAAGAAQGATTVPIDALTQGLFTNTVTQAQGNILIPSGTTLSFGGAKFARLTADAVLGATSLTVAALPTALVDDDTARFNRFGAKYLPSGILIGRTLAERAAGDPWGPAALTDDEIFLTRYDVDDLAAESGNAVVRHGMTIKENYLPDYATLAAAVSEVQIITISGTPSGGTFTLTFEGDTTTALAYNAAAATVQTALRALGTIGATDVTVAGNAGGPYTVTFAADMANAPQELIQADPGGLTGGTPAIKVERSVGGGTALLAKLRELYMCITGVD